MYINVAYFDYIKLTPHQSSPCFSRRRHIKTIRRLVYRGEREEHRQHEQKRRDDDVNERERERENC